MKIGSLDVNPYLDGPPKIGFQDMDSEDSVRNVQGTMMRDRIGTKIKWQLKFGPLTTAQLGAVLAAVSPVFFPVTYLNPLTGSNRTAQFYVGDRTVGLLREGAGVWVGAEMNLIER